jgi:hypothetical protein
MCCCFLEASLVAAVVDNPQEYIASTQGLIFASHSYQRLSGMPPENKKKKKIPAQW